MDKPPYRLALCLRAEADKAAGLPPEIQRLFSAEEFLQLRALPERRLRDRVAGRLAAKRALAEHFSAEGWTPEPRELEIFNDPAGRPVLRLPAGFRAALPAFSIAHCAEGGAAAVARPARRVGVDFELMIVRPLEVLAFVAEAVELICAPASNPEAQARLWTGKEAALKLLGLGLDADAKGVREEEGGYVFSGLPAETWRKLGSPQVRAVFERQGAALLAVAYT